MSKITIISEAVKLLRNVLKGCNLVWVRSGDAIFQQACDIVSSNSAPSSSVLCQEISEEKLTGSRIHAADGLLQAERMEARYHQILSSPIWQEREVLRAYRQIMSDMLKTLQAERVLQEGVGSGAVEVFVALYHSDAMRSKCLSIWVGMLRRIQFSVASRPIYLSEGEARRGTANNVNESYVRLVVPKASITQCEGEFRISAVVTVNNIRSFHWRGQLYLFDGNDLRASSIEEDVLQLVGIG